MYAELKYVVVVTFPGVMLDSINYNKMTNCTRPLLKSRSGNEDCKKDHNDVYK